MTVYVVYSPAHGLHKIGYTENVPHRVEGIRSMNPGVELVLSFPGTRDLEAYLHEQFKEYKVTGEWFRLQDAAEVPEVAKSFDPSEPVNRRREKLRTYQRHNQRARSLENQLFLAERSFRSGNLTDAAKRIRGIRPKLERYSTEDPSDSWRWPNIDEQLTDLQKRVKDALWNSIQGAKAA